MGFKTPQFGGPEILVAGDGGSSANGNDDGTASDGGKEKSNAGVSAMHLVLLPKIDRALMFDATIWKISKLKLPGPPCRKVEGTNKEDCWCHSVLMDVETGNTFISYFTLSFFPFLFKSCSFLGNRLNMIHGALGIAWCSWK
ncbi:uncharacterized protein LOC120134326 [Hibiscus syriacus]|uniref:uncharacterized protein LOC120134326 n=1 Tax=Hibiscus syriacus TaxID=106335 RepID=UPI001923926F|nr:uncharacterized protein LOC120134326 [Hibiscus syriacus]